MNLLEILTKIEEKHGTKGTVFGVAVLLLIAVLAITGTGVAVKSGIAGTDVVLKNLFGFGLI